MLVQLYLEPRSLYALMLHVTVGFGKLLLRGSTPSVLVLKSSAPLQAALLLFPPGPDLITLS